MFPFALVSFHNPHVTFQLLEPSSFVLFNVNRRDKNILHNKIKKTFVVSGKPWSWETQRTARTTSAATASTSGEGPLLSELPTRSSIPCCIHGNIDIVFMVIFYFNNIIGIFMCGWTRYITFKTHIQDKTFKTLIL